MSSDLTLLDETAPDGSLIPVAQLDDFERQTRAALKGWVALEHDLKGRHAIPSGNTANRPVTNLAVGALYINTQLQQLEYWTGTQWLSATVVPSVVYPISFDKGGTGLTTTGAEGNLLTSHSGAWISSPLTTAISLLSIGYFQLGEFLLQWGNVSVSVEGVYPVVFPLPYTTVFQVIAVVDTTGLGTPGSPTDPNTWAQVRDLTATGFNATVEFELEPGGTGVNAATYIRWFAIGRKV